MKRLPLFSAILTSILLFVSGLQAAKPNVVLIITDDQGYGCLLYTSPSPRD